ncbi:MAG: DUF3267 domain-containing protein, partial [Oscillospiraceae bacterium]|nr:DUF3267 domain-containing protein [Oscillospiraceae bacterium]
IVANIVAVILFLVLYAAVMAIRPGVKLSGIGFIIAMLCLVPHEFLHALCFKEDVKMYHALSKGMLFVHGTEDMTKIRFVMMSLCPNIVFGLIPLVLFLIFPKLTVLGAMGILSLAMGAGDYYNVINALTQMPKGALTYLSGFHSYWYVPGVDGGGK